MKIMQHPYYEQIKKLINKFDKKKTTFKKKIKKQHIT